MENADSLNTSDSQNYNNYIKGNFDSDFIDQKKIKNKGNAGIKKWLVIANNHGVIYFYNKSFGNCQWTYPKEYDKRKQKYVNIFFTDWEKIITPNSRYWKNIYTNQIQKVKPYSTTYLLEAAFMDNFAFVQFYLENNGNINVTDKQGRNALHYAIMNDNINLIKYLLGNDINQNKQDTKFLQSPVYYAIQYRAYNSLKILIEHGCNLNIQDYKGNTPLHNAIRTKNVKLIFFLVESGTKLTIKNKKKQFPIDIAVEEENWSLVKYLTKLSNMIVFNKRLNSNDGEKIINNLEKLQIKENYDNYKPKLNIQEKTSDNTQDYSIENNQIELKNKSYHKTNVNKVFNNDIHGRSINNKKQLKENKFNQLLKIKNKESIAQSVSIRSIDFEREEKPLKERRLKIVKKDYSYENDYEDDDEFGERYETKNKSFKNKANLKIKKVNQIDLKNGLNKSNNKKLSKSNSNFGSKINSLKDTMISLLGKSTSTLKFVLCKTLQVIINL